MDARILIQHQQVQIEQLKLAVFTLGTFTARQQAVMRAAIDAMDTLNPNTPGIQARIKELVDTAPHTCSDQVIQLIVENRKLQRTIESQRKMLADVLPDGVDIHDPESTKQ